MATKKINSEKGSILLFTIITLSIMTILFATLISVTYNRLSATKKAADANEYQTYLENLGNYYIGESEYIHQVAFLAADYYVKAEYYTAKFTSEFTVDLYEGEAYNALLKAVIEPLVQSNYNVIYLEAQDPVVLRTELTTIASDIYAKTLIYLLDLDTVIRDTNIPEQEVRYVNRVERWLDEHNKQLVEAYDLDPGSEPIKSKMTLERHGLAAELLRIVNEVDIDIDDKIFGGATSYRHEYEIVFNYYPEIRAQEIAGNPGKYELKLIESPTDIEVIKWQVDVNRTP